MVTILRAFFPTFLILTLFWGCQKKLSQPQTTIFDLDKNNRYRSGIISNIAHASETYSSRSWDRIISLRSNKVIGVNQVSRYEVLCVLKDSIKTPATYGDLVISGEVLPYLPEKSWYEKRFPHGYQPIKGCFGDSTTIQMTNASDATILEDRFYIPMELNATLTGHNNWAFGSSLSRNAVFTWNPDPKNDKGIAIYIYFSAKSGFNDAFSNYNSLSTRIFTEDDGEFQLSEKNFKGMPSGAVISIEIARGNYKTMLDSEGRHYFVYAYSECYSDFFLE